MLPIVLACMLVLCHAQVEIKCTAGTVLTELLCQSYTVKSDGGRAVTFVGPTPANIGLVTSLFILHPSRDTFIADIFSTFPNLQKLLAYVDGTARLSQHTFRYATNLVELDINPIGLAFDPLDDFSFVGANRLEKLTLHNIFPSGDYPFYYLTNLVSLTIDWGADVRPIADIVFNPLINLKKIDLREFCLKTIPATMFANNLQLENIFISDFLLKAVESTFIDHLPNLKSIRFSGVCARANWNFPEPISQFHAAMAPCYANYVTN